MRRMRSKLNNLAYPAENDVSPPHVVVQGVGPNRQTSAIQSQLQAAGICPQQMMPDMYGPGGYAQPYEQQPHEQQPYPHMQPNIVQPGMMQPMPPQMQMPQQANQMQTPQQANQMPMPQQANMYQAPQQMPQSAPGSEMNHVMAGLDRLASNIQQLAANSPVGGEDAGQVQKQNELITAELMELRKQIAATSENSNTQDLAAQLEAIRQAVEATLAKSANPETFASAVEASHKKISEELYEFKNALSNNNSNPEMLAHTFEARHDEISRSINDLQHSINAAIGNPGLYAETVENSHRQLSQQFEDFKHSMQEQAAVNQQVEEPDFSAIEMRLEEITRAVVALSAGNQGQDGLERIEARISDLAKTVTTPQASADPIHIPNYDEHFNQVHHNFQMLETRLNELGTVEHNDSGALDMQIQQISDKMDVLSAANNQVNEVSLQGVEGLEQHITLLSEKLDNIASISNENLENATGEASSGSDNSALIGRLDELVGEVVHLRADNSNDQDMANRMNELVTQLETLSTNRSSGDAHTDQIIEHLKDLSQSVDKLAERDASTMQNVDLSSLETQLNQISQHLNTDSQLGSVDALPIDEISQRLTGIEQQIGASRDIAIELASQAATDAVEKTMSEIPAGIASGEGVDNLAIQEISQNIQNLNEQTASAHAQYIEKFDAMKSSLAELTNRNDKLESKFGGLNTNPQAGDTDQDHHVVIEAEANEKAFEEPKDESHYNEILEQAHSEIEPDNNTEQVDSAAELSPFTYEEQNEETTPVETTAEESYSQEPLEEFSYAQQQQQDETSTADLINKIRENARAEQHLAEESSSDKKPQVQAEQVLAEVAGVKLETTAFEETHQTNMAEQAHEATVGEEVNRVYEEVASSQVPQTFEEPALLSAQDQAMPTQAQQNDTYSPLPHVEVPSLDATHDDDLPLEPGSPGPDLAELVRQVNERRMDSAHNDLGGSGSDFLASARRAAQAAAQEANMVEEEIEQKEKKGLLASLPALLAKKKKVLLIGVVAVAMIAIAMPFISGLTKSTTEDLASEKTVIIEQSVSTNDSDPVFSDEPVIEEEQLTPENEVAEVSIDEPVDSSFVAPANAADGQEQSTDVQSNEVEPVVENQVTQAEPEASVTPQYDVSQLTFVTSELKDAAQQGNLAAMFEIGRQYTNGVNTKKDLAKAAMWYERAAVQGHAPAQYMVGNFNEKGFGMEPNVTNAVTWYEKAANQGNVIAMHNLGVLYATPGKLSQQPNMEQAFMWFKKAADHGVRDSQVNMGIFYTQGLGTEVNLTEAYKWFSISSKDGDSDAKKKLSIVEERLRPEQKQEAKTLVENWKPIEADPAANEVNTLDSWKTKSAPQRVAKLDRKTVQQTQAVLNKLGYSAGNPDGIMGKQTKTAISNYQKTEGLKVTGTINPELVKSLIAKMSG